MGCTLLAACPFNKFSLLFVVRKQGTDNMQLFNSSIVVTCGSENPGFLKIPTHLGFLGFYWVLCSIGFSNFLFE